MSCRGSGGGCQFDPSGLSCGASLVVPVDGGRLDDQLDFWDVGTRGLSSLRSIAHFLSATQLHVIHSPMTACAHMSVVFHFIQITGLWMDGMK